MSAADDRYEITPDILLRAYSIGLFPMAESADDPSLFWVDPEERGIIPLDELIVSRSLAKTIRSDRFQVKVDTDFDGVIEGCAGRRLGREDTWISERIRALYRALFSMGFVHTVEAWEGNTLVGGLYGVCIGSAFFGESMFHKQRDASKVALAHLVARLRVGGFRLLDTQFVTEHLATLGARALARADYQRVLREAIVKEADYGALDKLEQPVDGSRVLTLLSESRPDPSSR